MCNIAKCFLQQPTSYKKRKQDLEYSAEVYQCSIHELEDPGVVYPDVIEWYREDIFVKRFEWVYVWILMNVEEWVIVNWTIAHFYCHAFDGSFPWQVL